MPRRTKTITLSLPPEMVEEIDRLTEEEGRNRSELLREAFRRYVEEKEWKSLYQYGERRARKAGIRQDQVEAIVDAQRS